MPRRSALEEWHVFRRMAAIDDMVQYIPAEDEEDCKTERSFDNDEMELTCAGVAECKDDSPTVDDVIDKTVLKHTLDAIYHHDNGD
jgi:hypothetical protein